MILLHHRLRRSYMMGQWKEGMMGHGCFWIRRREPCLRMGMEPWIGGCHTHHFGSHTLLQRSISAPLYYSFPLRPATRMEYGGQELSVRTTLMTGRPAIFC